MFTPGSGKTETGTTFQLSGSRKYSPATSGKPKTILRVKSLVFNVYYEGKNLTPKPLNPDLYHLARERQIGVYDESSSLSWKESGSVATHGYDTARSTLRFRTEIADNTMDSLFHAGNSPRFCVTIEASIKFKSFL